MATPTLAYHAAMPAGASEKTWRLVLAAGLASLSSCQSDPARDEIENLERWQRALTNAAQALLRTDGCAGSADCAAAAVGHKPCGGPRTYWVYCRRTTDERALLRTLEELSRTEQRLNAIKGLLSDCAIVQPPAVVAVGGVCRSG
jgi:hypothetical protein